MHENQQMTEKSRKQELHRDTMLHLTIPTIVAVTCHAICTIIIFTAIYLETMHVAHCEM